MLVFSETLRKYTFKRCTLLHLKLWDVLKKEVSYAEQGCIYLTKNTGKNIYFLNLKWFLSYIFFLDCNLFKAEFLASLLQFSVSRGPSKIILIYWFGAYGRSLIIIIVENGCAD